MNILKVFGVKRMLKKLKNFYKNNLLERLWTGQTSLFDWSSGLLLINGFFDHSNLPVRPIDWA